MRLYKVKICGGYSSNSTNYNEVYVIAEDPTSAYEQYREFLDDNGICYEEDRALESIQLIADSDCYGNCKHLLFLPIEKDRGSE
jgi:hypothetical protein